MALTFEQQQPVETELVGVGLVIIPPRDATTNIPWEGGIEIQRAPDAAGVPGTWATIAQLDHVPPAGGRYIDTRPWTTSIFWYRYRPIRGGGVGNFSAAVSATPGLFPRGAKLGFQAGDAAAFYAGVRSEPLSDGMYALQAVDTAGQVARDGAAKLVTDFANAVVTVTDGQGSPKVRGKFGKVGAGAADYGLQVFDQNGATVADFTGAKRILAVPVQDMGAKKTANFTLDLSTGLTLQVMLGASGLNQTMIGMTDGGRYRVLYQQDETGSRTIPTIVDADGQPFPVMWLNDTPEVLSTTPGLLDLVEFEYRVVPSGRFVAMQLKKGISPITPTAVGVNPTTTSIAVGSTSHPINMPATVANKDLLVMIFAQPGTAAPTTPSGWTALGNTQNGGGLATSGYVYAKIADGTEGGATVDVVTGVSIVAVGHVYRFQKAYKVSAVNAVSFSGGGGPSGTSANPNPPGQTPTWGLDSDIWISIAVYHSNNGVNSYPASYANGAVTAASTIVSLATARRALFATTEDPGTYTLSASNDWCAGTIAIRPSE